MARQLLPLLELERLITEKRGNIAAVARVLGVPRRTVYNRLKESARLQQLLADARETMLDDAESTLYDEALTGNTTALIFFLKTQGKGRGYTERQEYTGANGEPLKLYVGVSPAEWDETGNAE